MPFVLLVAQLSGIAQLPEFIGAILVASSIAPIQVYLNEVYAPIAVRFGQPMSLLHGLEIGTAILVLTGWLAYRLSVDGLSACLIVLFAQGYVWFSYFASRRILNYQARSVIGGRYSYIIGSIIPLTFLVVVLLYWMLLGLGVHAPLLLYLLILIPNAFQYLYIRYGWATHGLEPLNDVQEAAESANRQAGGVWFLAAMAMALVAQHWKVELTSVATGFAAISIYLISPFSSMWLIFSKSKFMTRHHLQQTLFNFWLLPCCVGLTMMLQPDYLGWVFALALVSQVFTFKFITDIRIRLMPLR